MSRGGFGRRPWGCNDVRPSAMSVHPGRWWRALSKRQPQGSDDERLNNTCHVVQHDRKMRDKA
jgi:hypothetical protein